MIEEIAELRLAQEDGGLPTIFAAGGAPGESGVIVVTARFRGGMHINATPRRHHICFQISEQSRFACRIGDQALSHEPRSGSLAICPAGIDYAADAAGTLDAVLVAIDPRKLALAAAEDATIEPQLVERLSGYDQALLDLGRELAGENAGSYPTGALFWNEVAGAFIDGLITRHTVAPRSRARGALGKDVIKRLRDYIIAHLDEPIDVAKLANIAGRSPFHFTRVFARSVGTTPHRYVVHLRLRRAIELIRDERTGLAEAAAQTGFADQSHLSRWVRRVHGASLSELVA